MAISCEICGKPNPSRKDRFCRKHQKSVLRHLALVGYLEPVPGKREPRPEDSSLPSLKLLVAPSLTQKSLSPTS